MQTVERILPASRILIAGASAVLATAYASVSFAAGTPREAGVWFDETGKGAVKIEVCGGDKLCGRIVWLKDLVNDQGEVLTDKNNPDPEQRARTICGLPVIGQLAPMPEGGYDGGWVYDPKVGKSYSVAIELTSPDELTVTGYKGVKLLGKSFGWTRAKTELPSCAGAPPQTKSDAAKPGAVKTGAAPAVGAATATAKTPDSRPQQPKSATATSDGAAKPATTVAAKPATQKSAAAPAQKPVAKAKTAADAGETLPWATKPGKPASAAADE